MPLSDVVSPSFREGFPRLCIIITWLAVVMLAFDLLTGNLGLVAFSWVMWVTIPWAFEERLNLETLSKKVVPEMFRYKFERTITLGDVKKASDWLEAAADSFLYAGAFFLLSAGAEALSGPLETWRILFNSPKPPIPFEGLVYLMFIAAFAVMAFGVYKGQQVIKFIANPSQIDRIARFGALFRISIARLLNFGYVSVSGAFEIILFVGFTPVWVTPFTYQTVALRILDATLLAGGLAIVPVLRSWKKPPEKASWKEAIPAILVTIPFVNIGLLLLLLKVLA